MKHTFKGKIQRERLHEEHMAMVAVGLWCQLRVLVRQIKGGQVEKLIEFQQMLQYASPEMKAELLEQISDL